MALIINVGLSAVSCHPCPFLFTSTESKIQTGNPVQFVTMVSSCHLTCDLLCNLLLLSFSSGAARHHSLLVPIGHIVII